MYTTAICRGPQQDRLQSQQHLRQLLSFRSSIDEEYFQVLSNGQSLCLLYCTIVAYNLIPRPFHVSFSWIMKLWGNFFMLIIIEPNHKALYAEIGCWVWARDDPWQLNLQFCQLSCCYSPLGSKKGSFFVSLCCSVLQGQQLKNPHLAVKHSPVAGGRVALVQGDYLYYHYMQDGFNDNVRTKRDDLLVWCTLLCVYGNEALHGMLAGVHVDLHFVMFIGGVPINECHNLVWVCLRLCTCVRMHTCVCVCVCVRERERE